MNKIIQFNGSKESNKITIELTKETNKKEKNNNTSNVEKIRETVILMLFKHKTLEDYVLSLGIKIGEKHILSYLPNRDVHLYLVAAELRMYYLNLALEYKEELLDLDECISIATKTSESAVDIMNFIEKEAKEKFNKSN